MSITYVLLCDGCHRRTIPYRTETALLDATVRSPAPWSLIAEGHLCPSCTHSMKTMAESD